MKNIYLVKVHYLDHNVSGLARYIVSKRNKKKRLLCNHEKVTLDYSNNGVLYSLLCLIRGTMVEYHHISAASVDFTNGMTSHKVL